MNKPTAKAILERNALFRDLPEAAIEQVASLARRRVYAKGEIIFSAGDEGDALYGVAAGEVRVTTSSSDGKVVFLNLMQHGDIFGEISVMDGLPRTAGAEAAEETTLIVIQRTEFLRLLEHEPRVAIHLLSLFCQRLRWTTDIVHETAFLSIDKPYARRRRY